MRSCRDCKKPMTKQRCYLERNCSACESKEIKADRAFLLKKKSEQKIRNCRVCNKKLPVERYFHCVSCEEHAGTSGFIYSFQA